VFLYIFSCNSGPRRILIIDIVEVLWHPVTERRVQIGYTGIRCVTRPVSGSSYIRKIETTTSIKHGKWARHERVIGMIYE
jgi:hypothetical protein